jgi:hypothetical protein
MKPIPAYCVIIVMCLTILWPGAAHAQVDIGIGGIVCYNQWDPAWHKGRILARSLNKSKQVIDHSQNIHDFESAWMPLYGPVLSMTIMHRIMLSSTFIYGTTDFRSDGIASNIAVNYTTSTVTASTGYRMYRRETVKMDDDTTLGFIITDYLYIYAGYKFQSYRYRETSKSLQNFTDPKVSTPRHKSNDSHGAGLGIGFNIHIYDELFMQAAISAVLMDGREESSNNYVADISTGGASVFLHKRGHYLAYGGTFVPSFAYRTPVDITLYIGFKGQMLQYRQLRDREAYELFNKSMDFFYGLYFSAVYNISFGRNKT